MEIFRSHIHPTEDTHIQLMLELDTLTNDRKPI